jgi:uncharacterized sodium:solute symporter family permease YidK
MPVSNLSQTIACPDLHDSSNAICYEWLPVPILIFFAVFLLPLFFRARVSTAPEFLEARFGGGCRRLFSGFLLFANLFIDAAAALYAGATISDASRFITPQISS